MAGNLDSSIGACMWVFGYGSLMWDRWEKNFSCLQRQVAELRGYRRSFSKASVKNWGSPTNPGPTLNLEGAEHSVCIGVAFEFSNEPFDEVCSYLSRREGKGFALRPLHVWITNEQTVNAFVPSTMARTSSGMHPLPTSYAK